MEAATMTPALILAVLSGPRQTENVDCIFWEGLDPPLRLSVTRRDIGGRLNPASSSRCFWAWLIRDHN